MTHAAPNRRRPQRRGLSLIELLMGLAIGAILLTALATAVSAAGRSIQVNQRLFSSTQMARVALAQMAARARTANQVEVNANSDTDFAVIYVTMPLFDALTKAEISGSSTRYAYVYDGATLYLDENPPIGTTTSRSTYLAGLTSGLTSSPPAASILARNVSAMSVRELTKGAQTVSVSISLTVTDPQGKVAFSAEESVACRRTLTPSTVPASGT